MITLKFEHNLQPVAAFLGDMTNIQRKAAAAAINRVTTQARTQASKSIREKYNFKAADIRKTFRIYKSTPTNLQSTLVSRGRRTPLVAMSARQVKAGVSVRVGNQTKLIKHAFIATMKSGHKGVFARTTKKSLPIKELYTIAVPEAFLSRTVGTAMQQKVNSALPDRYEHELKRLMKAQLRSQLNS